MLNSLKKGKHKSAFDKQFSPGWCGSVDGALAYEPKVTGLILQSGTCLGWRPGPWLGAFEREPNDKQFREGRVHRPGSLGKKSPFRE